MTLFGIHCKINTGQELGLFGTFQHPFATLPCMDVIELGLLGIFQSFVTILPFKVCNYTMVYGVQLHNGGGQEFHL